MTGRTDLEILMAEEIHQHFMQLLIEDYVLYLFPFITVGIVGLNNHLLNLTTVIKKLQVQDLSIKGKKLGTPPVRS